MLSSLFRPLVLVLGVASEDLLLAQQLQKHLTPLQEQRRVICWSPQQIPAGKDFKVEIETRCRQADLFLLLISPDFFVSSTCQQIMQYAQEQAQEGLAIILPILLRPVDLEATSFETGRLLPWSRQPVKNWPDPDDAWKEIAQQIRLVVTLLHQPVLLVADPSLSSCQQQIIHDLKPARLPIFNWSASEPTPLHETMRQVSSVIVLLSPETCYAHEMQDIREAAAIHQCLLIVLWSDDELHTSSLPEPWLDMPSVSLHSLSYARDLLLLLQQRLYAVLPGEKLVKLASPRNPYKGLRSFQATDAGDFFGRKALVEDLLALLKAMLALDARYRQTVRLLAVVGSSGSGKSSVVFAGLIPRLYAGALPSSERWLVLSPLVLGNDPLEALSIALAAQLPDVGLKTLYEDLEGGPVSTLHQYAVLISQKQKIPAPQVVLIIDQMEELFQPSVSELHRRRFLEILLTAITMRRGPLLVILTLRADFLDRLMSFPDLYRLIDAHRQTILPLTTNELREAIEAPAALPDVHMQFEDHLVSDILLALHGQPSTLPLLQFTLDLLFERREGHLLTHKAYQQIGGVTGSLAEHAENTYTHLPSDLHRECTRTIFLRLITPGATEQAATCRRTRWGDLPQTSVMQEIASAFIDARLLTTSTVANTSVIEVSHETLLREWPRLVTWIQEQQDDLHLQHTLDERVDQWEQDRHASELLYRGKQLKEARTWAKRNILISREQEFLQVSIRHHVLSLIRIIVIVLLLVTSVSATVWYAFHLPPDPTHVINSNDDGPGSLRWCIANAQDKSTITFDKSIPGTIPITSSDLSFEAGKTLTIQGSGATALAISNKHTDSGLHIFPNASVTFSRLRFNENTITKGSQFIDNQGTLQLRDVIFSDNSTMEGNIINNSGTLQLNTSLFSANSTHNGNVILNNGGMVSLNNSTFSANQVHGTGTILDNQKGGTVSLTNSTFSHNSTEYGGIIGNETGKVFLNGSTLDANSTSSYGLGGAISNSDTVSLLNSTLSANSGGDGGGIFNMGGTVSLFNSTLSANTAALDGGGIYNMGGTISLLNSTLSANSANWANSHGGAIASEGNGTISLFNSTLFANSATQSGGGIYSENTRINIIFCTLFENKAGAQGGGIFLADSILKMSNSILAANRGISAPDILGTLTSGGYNLVQNSAGSFFMPTAEHTTDHLIPDLPYTFAKDAKLSNNGGPTQTLALLLSPKNPAINAIPSQYCQIKTIFDAHSRRYTDQRGMKRSGGTKVACDIGAYETQI